MGCQCTTMRKTITVASVGIVLVIVGVVLGPIKDHVIHEQVKKKLVLEEGSTVYKIWKDVPFPIYQQFYVFNIDNPDEVLSGGKPNVTEHGPYTYREYRVKDNITFSDEGNKISYNQRKYFTFVPDMSVGSEDDHYITINPLLPTISQLLVHVSEGRIIKMITDLFLKSFSENLFHNRTIHEIIWGYRDKMLTAAHLLAPDWFYTDIIGYMAGKNDSYDGNYTLYTGKDNVTDLGKIDLYNGSSVLDFWTTNYSNMINGTDGSLHQPFMGKSTILYTFITDVCRSIEGRYQRTTTVRGFDVYEFIAPSSVFANKSVNPDNAGFCTPPTHCLGTGVLNVSTCQEFDNIHLPAVLSNPHFLDADAKYQDSVNGLHPDQTVHQTSIDVEPITGIMLKANKRLQINIYLRNDSNFQDLKNVEEMIFPVMWVNESSTIDKDTASTLYSTLFLPMLLVDVLRVTLIIVGAVMLLGSITFILYRRKKVKTISNTTLENEPLLRDVMS